MKLHSLKDIAKIYGITVPMLQKLIQNNQITRVKVGAKNFISEDIIEKYISDNTVKASA